MLSCETTFAHEFNEAADQRPVGGSGHRVQTVGSGGSVGAGRSLRSILLLQDAHRGCGLEVLQSHGRLPQQLDNLRNLSDLCPHPQIANFPFQNADWSDVYLWSFGQALSLLSWLFLFLGSVAPYRNIYTPRVFILAMHRTNQGPVLHCVADEPTIHLWIHVWRIVWPQIDRGSALAPPGFINKHAGHGAGDAFAWTALQSDPRSEEPKRWQSKYYCHTFSPWTNIWHIVGCACVFALFVFGVCVRWQRQNGHFQWISLKGLLHCNCTRD